MTEHPKYVGYVNVYLGTKDKLVPVDKVKVLDAERDYTGHDVYVTFKYKRVRRKSRLIWLLDKSKRD